MTASNSSISITTLSINCLNTPIGRQRLASNYIHNPTIYCLQETYFQYNDIGKLKRKDGRLYHAHID